ncbi:MAG TPA: HAMP domain-containing sensor histidine kinase [Acidimicrobiales bacterium]|nr:HAMP domain-containing sensor histidine kinase [Acidimicrobiales bacterium]
MAAPLATELTTGLAVGRAAPARAPGRLTAFLTSARVRILGWYVVLLVVTIGASLVAQRTVLMHRMVHRIDTQLSVNLEDLARQAQPSGGSASVDSLFSAFLSTHVPGPGEQYLALVGGHPYRSTGGGYPLARVPGFNTSVAHLATSVRGDLSTPGGAVRYLAVPVASAGQAPSATFVAAQFTAASLGEVNSEVGVAAAVSLTLLLVMSVIAWLVAGRILVPVRLMTDTAQSISDTDLTRRIARVGDDEIGQLARTFNAMLDRLQAAFVSQREFINDASHELRTPITIIRGHLELLGDDPAEREETMFIVRDELDRMSRMVEDLLLLAKAERPGFLRLEPVRVDDLVSELMAKITAIAPRRWVCQSSGSVRTMADRQRLTQAVMNLTVNAVAHTTERDTIALGFAGGRDEFRLWVSDTGTGITAEDQTRIFERFARGRNERRRSQGSGLGLAIVRAIVEAHRGRVELASSPGQGATFTLVLPVQPPRQEET